MRRQAQPTLRVADADGRCRQVLGDSGESNCVTNVANTASYSNDERCTMTVILPTPSSFA